MEDPQNTQMLPKRILSIAFAESNFGATTIQKRLQFFFKLCSLLHEKPDGIEGKEKVQPSKSIVSKWTGFESSNEPMPPRNWLNHEGKYLSLMSEPPNKKKREEQFLLHKLNSEQETKMMKEHFFLSDELDEAPGQFASE